MVGEPPCPRKREKVMEYHDSNFAELTLAAQKFQKIEDELLEWKYDRK